MAPSCTTSATSASSPIGRTPRSAVGVRQLHDLVDARELEQPSRAVTRVRDRDRLTRGLGRSVVDREEGPDPGGVDEPDAAEVEHHRIGNGLRRSTVRCSSAAVCRSISPLTSTTKTLSST